MQSMLQPPVIHTLSDHVIGRVVQRAWLSRDNVGITNDDDRHEPQNRHHPTSCSPDSVDKPVICSSSPSSEGLSTQRPPDNHLGSKRFKLGNGRSLKAADTSSAQRREYYRCKQQRYRENQRKRIVALEYAIQQLCQEVESLKRRRDLLTVQVPRRLTVWIAVTEYVRIFQSGIHDNLCSNDNDFLHATMSPDALFGAVRGLEAHMENWRLFTQFFPDVDIRLSQLKQIRAQSLIADITATFTISDTSIWHVFPHLFTSGEGTRCARIAAKIRGQRLVLQGSIRFEWDDESSQVSCIQTHLDMMPALRQILTDLEDIALLFNKAHITPECNIREGFTV